jgi:hypothetical protein
VAAYLGLRGLCWAPAGPILSLQWEGALDLGERVTVKD